MKPLDPNKITGIWSPGPGKRLPETTRALATRDSLLRMAARSIPGSAREKARQLRQMLARYQCGRWKRDRLDGALPDRDAILFTLLQVRDAIPSERSIRRAIRGPREAQ